ncbi:MAG: phosphoribosylglycinamide formyltransferase [Buchananella hordeovulneris]|nr:phosphoribosylglycinamide formyltransferase [Buchananella hordeovulneris]
MTALTDTPGVPLRIALLASGGGSNARDLIAAAAADPNFEVVGLATDRPGVGALDIAAAAGVPTEVVRLADFPARTQWDAALTAAVAAWQPDLVVSVGFLKLLGPAFLARFGGATLNTHNSLLPAFPGITGPADALAYGVKLAGATLFVVDAGVDTGRILAQVAVPVLPGDDVETLTERIKVAERAQLVECVAAIAACRSLDETKWGQAPD